MSFTDFILKRLDKDKVAEYLQDLDVSDSKFHNEENDAIIYRVKENYAWFKGSSASLAYFYKNVSDPESFSGYKENNFWKWSQKDSKVPKVHIPVASQISQAMSTLVFDEFPSWDISAGSQERNTALSQIIEDCFAENGFTNMCQKGAQLESYSGSLACKFTLDPEFSNTPILEFYPFGDFWINEKYGRIFEIVFKDLYEVGKKKFLLNSIYGKGYIKYKLFDITEKKREVPLNTLESTKGLKNIRFIDEAGKPLQIMMAAYKVNRPANPDAPNSNLGCSDYAGLASIFDAIDSLASLRQNYFKYGSRIKRVVSEDQLEKDNEGNVIVKEDSDGLDLLVLKDSNPMDTTQIKDTVVPSLSDAPFAEAIANHIGYCCDRCGLSRTSFGVEQAGRNASAESLSVRQDANYRTRQAKVKLWTKFIEDIMELVLIYSVTQDIKEVEGTAVITIPSAILGYSYTVTFPPFEQESDAERAERIINIESTGYITREDALKLYYEPLLEPKDVEAKVKEMINYEPQIPSSYQGKPVEFQLG